MRLDKVTIHLKKAVKTLGLVTSIYLSIIATANAEQQATQTATNNASSSIDSLVTGTKTAAVFDNAHLQRLATHPQWQHLLFYKNGKAEVISEGFYFSDPKSKSPRQFSPYNELIQTLSHIDNKESVCQFPARYLWLSHHLENVQVDLSGCASLPDPNKKISLILISSYLKNPASSFGHVLVKTSDADISHYDSGDTELLSQSKQSPQPQSQTQLHSQVVDSQRSSSLSSEDLLNNTYNFGARIPQNENGVMYALKGLFGFYDAGFAETEFFKQDAVYSKNEQRDMWEYVLNLDAFNTQLLNYHMHEAKSARFDYYFIKQNCGYRSGEILELISDVKTTDRLGPWYAPDYVFDQLVEHDNTAQPPIVEKIRYLPSEQTQLRHKFVQLPKSMQSKINHIIKAQDKGVFKGRFKDKTKDSLKGIESLKVLDDLSEADKALALDFLILHQTYKISQDDTPENHAFKKHLISKRFMLPKSNVLAQMTVPNKPSPALSNKTTQTQIALSDESAELGLTLFVKDPLNSYTDINKRFEAVNTTVEYNFDDDKLALKEFVFLDMQQIEDLTQPLAGEPKLSWQLKTGTRQDPFNGNQHRPYAQGGIGAGAIFGEHILGYAMLDVTVHDQQDKFDIGVEVGLRAKREGRSLEISHKQIARSASKSVATTTLTLRQQLSKNNDARLLISHVNNDNLADDGSVTAGIAWHHYW